MENHQQFIASLQEALEKLVFANETQLIQSISSTLAKDYFTVPLCVPALFEITLRSDKWQVRQLAAVELRKGVPKYWAEVGADTQKYIRDNITHTIVNEPNHLARHGLARVISSIAKIDLPNGAWAELMQFLYTCCNSTQSVQREIGVYVLDSLFETVADTMADNLSHIIDLFAKLAQDPESHMVRVATVRALGQAAELIDSTDKPNVKKFQGVVPSMVTVLSKSLEDGDEDSASSCFEVFNSLLLLEAPLLTPHFSQIVEFALKVGKNRDLDENLRIMALNFLVWTTTYKRSRLLKLGLVQPLARELIPITTEEDPADVDDDSPSRVSLRVLNVLSTNVPPQQFFPVVIEMVLQYVQSPDPMYRKGAMLTLAIVIEGCVDFVRSQVDDLVKLITQGMQDSSPIVRRASCLALGCVADEMGESIAGYHSTLLPIIFQLLGGSETEVVKHACNALDVILEGLDKDIIQYLPTLMEKLVLLLDNGPAEIRPMAMAAIGSAAHAAEKEFMPYFDAVVERTKRAMALRPDDESNVSLRGVATDSAGTLAEAVGKEKFQPHLEEMLKLALEGMKLESPNLRDCGFSFFGVLSRVFSDEMGQYLQYIVPEIIATFDIDDMSMLFQKEEEDDDDDDAQSDLQVSTAIADEKEVAADCSAEIFRNTRSGFLPYVESCTKNLLSLLDHYSDTTRKAAVAALFSFINTTSSMAQGQDWVPGNPLRVPVHQNVEEMIKSIIPSIIRGWEEEDDKMVVIQICTELRTSMELVGPAIILQNLNSVVTQLFAILEKTSLCQLEEEDGDGEDILDSDEMAEYDSLLIGAAADCLAGIAGVLGADFVPLMDEVLMRISNYYKPTCAPSDRSTAIGCLSEIAEKMNEGVTKYFDVLFGLFTNGVSDSSAEVRSNAAFGLGVLIQNASVDTSSQYPAILRALHPLLESGNESNQADNACGAVARLVQKNPNAVPLSELLPVWLSHLPLKSDHQEDRAVYDAIAYLVKNHTDQVKPFAEQLSHIVNQALNNPNTLMSEEARVVLSSL
ncbi:hypothetical protein H4219_002313 [Mycoemilia scoparia]|uniref:Importin N-terminal domain-containing protein n=1 Tax=Mycoemilia scoparia TaxID=417184 RepID=A0A9W7ZY44_9FUNG|nr:hypothetical protein H4219_002313 [Mycoemilia scoparia]